MSIDHYIVSPGTHLSQDRITFDTISAACAFAKKMRDQIGGQWKVYKVVETAVYGKEGTNG